MTDEREKNSQSSPAPANPLQFKLPEVANVEIYVLRDEQGNVIARTKDELNAAAGQE